MAAGGLVAGLHRSLAERMAMNTLEVEEQIAVRTANIEQRRLLRYALLIAAASYVIFSSYYISQTRSRLASLAVAQEVAIANLQKRQAATEADLKTSNQTLSQQLGITERGLQAAYAGTTAELRQNQKVFERRMQDQQTAAADQVTFEVKRAERCQERNRRYPYGP